MWLFIFWLLGSFTLTARYLIPLPFFLLYLIKTYEKNSYKGNKITVLK